MNEPKKCFAYYVEVFNIKDSSTYILQTKKIETIEKAYQFTLNFSYINNEFSVDIMGLVGDEENYDIVRVASVRYGELYRINKDYI